MSIHKLTAGSGYDYLTRQVAVHDSTEKGHSSLASYYSAKGETPGVWIGSGLSGIDGIASGDTVAEDQMRPLFGSGHHPLAAERRDALTDDASPAEVRAVTRLGTPFKVYESDVPRFQIEVARRIEDLNVAAGRSRTYPVSIEDQARVRSQVAREYFELEYGRPAADARELSATIAKHSRPKTTAVAGFDLSFSPVKSVSTLWAVADIQTAAKIEQAHQAAIRYALTFIENHALFTRVGTNGTRQVDVTGLVATAFTHRDSRAGDPDLHTHVAVANKVQTLDGRWLAIDGRPLFKAAVAASETYNTALERHLNESLGVRFEERAGTDPRKRPIREIVGVSPELNAVWSSRRASIETRRAELTSKFQSDHCRPPTPIESIQLAQQATLETREAKHEPRSLEDQRATWRTEATQALGSESAIDHMVSAASAGGRTKGVRVTSVWVKETAATVISRIETQRATWQECHVRAEAQRQVRKAEVSASNLDSVVGLIIEEALGRHSVALATDRDGVVESAELRRRDGSSVYHHAGSELFSSRRIFDAEARIVDAASRHDGRRVEPASVDLALLESAANGVDINADQAALVRHMATSGCRVQLGIAAAGTGKTTAMGVLTRAWEESGGNVVGLAPSAAAAAALRKQTGASTDTLAKLVHAIDVGDQAQMPAAIDQTTLVLIDEAGMADTISLDKAISYIVSQGASVKLIGDDQQLAAIGAGGILRDIDRTHGSVRLAELMRFEDPAEGAATLALREGLPEALGYYLDHKRVDVGDLSTLTDTVFNRWATDCASGLDSIMLAPTRDLVHELNARARRARIEQTGPTGAEASLSDGNLTSVGDIIITRNNDRRLRISATDWVKNGDRWQVENVHSGALTVRHTTTQLKITLPANYVKDHVELGYASTVHTAQGITVDTMHGLATGTETRQQFYTMMTRGRVANNVYLVVAGDGDEHNLIRPEAIHPKTGSDILADILARDGSPKSATTMASEAEAPEILLGQAAARYVDSLYVGAEKLIGTAKVSHIEAAAEAHVPGIGDEPAWPVLRAHLMLLEAQGRDSVREFTAAVADRTLDGVDDRAAILDWRLDPTGRRGTQPGPLPWLPAIPTALNADPKWGPYLTGRAHLVEQFASEARALTTGAETPRWARHGGARPTAEILGDVAVWRAANQVPADDRRPTGSPQLQKAAATYQRHLNEKVSVGRSPALAEWGPILDQIHPRRDQFTGLLADRLAAISRAGLDANSLLRHAASEGQLPDDHVAAALWWRISRHLSPTVATEASGHGSEISTSWSGRLVDVIGADSAAEVATSPWWPTLVASIDHAAARGWSITELLDIAKTVDDDVDIAQAMIWRIAIVTDPPPEDDPYDPYGPPEDLDEALTLRDDPVDLSVAEPDDKLAEVAFERSLLGPLERTSDQIERELERAHLWETSPVPGDRILAINELAATYYQDQFPRSWAQTHFQERLGHDLAEDQRFRPGYAPAGWTHLITHLHRLGVTDQEILAAGLIKEASTGRLIDRFRDRAVLPVIEDGKVLGFVARCNPDTTDNPVTGPKYLNTPDTIVFHKGAQLYGIAEPHMIDGSIPVVVEGPFDAIAVTLATGGAYTGVAPLGTSLTAEQATQLGRLGVDPIVATDGDLAGKIAAERDYWLLTVHDLSPRYARFGSGDDPASVLTESGPTPLRHILHEASPLANELLDERLSNIPDQTSLASSVSEIITAQDPETWQESITEISRKTGVPAPDLRDAVSATATQWNQDRTRFSLAQLDETAHVRTRREQAQNASPAERWTPLGRSLEPRLITQPDWAATAQMLQQIADAGHDVPAVTAQLISESPLGGTPARDLRYRLIAYLPDNHASPEVVPTDSTLHRQDQTGSVFAPAKTDKPPSR